MSLPPDSVVRVQLSHSRGLPLRQLRRRRESARVLVAAGEAAARMGWLSRALAAFQQGGLDAYDDSDLAGAVSAWNSRLAVCREIGDKQAMYVTLSNIAIVQVDLGNYPEALRAYDESLGLRREIGDKPGIAKALHGIGLVQMYLGNCAEALRASHEALALWREIGRKPGIADTLNNIGTARMKLGNFAEALRYFDDSLAVRREIGDKRGIARALNNTGIAQQALGDYPEALRSYDESLAIRREFRDKRGIARTLNSIGSVQSLLGKYPEALRSYDESLAITRENGDQQRTAETLNNIGNVRMKLGNFAEALRYFEDSLAVRREIGSRQGVAATLINIGLVQQRLGKYPEALRSYEKALAIDRKNGNKRDIAATLNNIAVVQEALGNPPEALESYAQAQRVLEEAPNPDTQVHVSWGLASLHLHQDRPAKAVGLARQGVRLVAGLAEGLAEGEGAGARDVFSGLFDVGNLAASRAGQVTDLLWFLEQGRAGSLREGLGSRAALERAVLPEGLRAALGVARNEERRALAAYRKVGGGGKRKEIREARCAWEESRAEVERVAARIQREAKAAAAVTLAATDDLEVIQSRLRPDEVLLLFGLTSMEAVALVVRKNKTRIVTLPDSKEIETAVDALLGDDERHVVPDMVDALSRSLVEPLKIDEDAKRVLVSPVGRLGYVPFSLLFPDREVVYVPSGTTHGLLLEQRSKRGEKILALGDPDYQTRTHAIALEIRAGNVTRLTSLPATRKEVDAIADVRYLGQQATETGLQERIEKQKRWRAIHFACHGFVDPERLMLSALALTADKENDGFLTALEIFRMKIPADLVVMSACETGKGKIYKTEGIVGLTRAFMFAGTPRVICSLWKVDDDATRALMVKFYEIWNPRDGSRGLPTATALKKAQEFVRGFDKWKHPYYWAAWQLWGLPD